MRLLLDECIDERLRYEFPGHECQTARYAQLAGLKNVRLLLAAEAAGFDVIVTVARASLAAKLRRPQHRALDLLSSNQPTAGPPTARAGGPRCVGGYSAGTCR
jgi:hypothetical protein